MEQLGLVPLAVHVLVGTLVPVGVGEAVVVGARVAVGVAVGEYETEHVRVAVEVWPGVREGVRDRLGLGYGGRLQEPVGVLEHEVTDSERVLDSDTVGDRSWLRDCVSV